MRFRQIITGGLRLIIFLDEKDFAENKERIDRELRRSLPPSFLGYPTSFNEPDKEAFEFRILVRLEISVFRKP